MATAIKPIIVIPSRLASTRLPSKPLADIHGAPMIVHCLRRAEAAGVAPVLVACGDRAIFDAVTAAGGKAVMTRSDHPSGSDRVFEAVEKLDPQGAHDVVINLQGDLPSLDPKVVADVLKPLEDPAVDIATLAVEITDPAERRNPDAPRAAVAFAPGSRRARALYFSRSVVPWPGVDDGAPLYYHLGIYAFRRKALARFVSLPQTVLEQREKLEQLRALEDGMRIDVWRVDTLPLGVDTPADLAKARALLAPDAAE